ncbi:MAG: tRNA1(Val) (adenine(37)-N6)-methyltransferase [Myxococcota bacterium]
MMNSLVEPELPRGIVRQARRPAGFQAPGPSPAGPGDREDLWPQPGEDLCYLSGNWRIFQRLEGHRWSVDDLVTAWVALECAQRLPPIRYALDLGCGIGSVLMMVAWGLPSACCVGIEAQGVSVGLARRSLAYNGIEERVAIRWGDLRDPQQLPEAGSFDLVTGTPPYFALEQGVISQKRQCGPCRFEFRGGIEAYCEAAARALAPQGRFVVCEDADQEARVELAATRAGLHLRGRLTVVPKEGRPPLFSVFTLAHAHAQTLAHEQADIPKRLTVRDLHGQWTSTFLMLRQRMGMPGNPTSTPLTTL